MRLHRFVTAVILATVLPLPACKRRSEGGAGTATTPAAPPSAPAARAPEASRSASSADDAAERVSAAEWATRQEEIKNDAQGQWAIQASASSTYNDAQGDAAWSASQATGAPDVERYGDDGKAWTPKTEDGGIEWLDLTYAKPVHASEVRVRESCGSGTVVKVEVFDEQGRAHRVWSGSDGTTGLNYLIVKFPRTDFKTARVKVTLATNVVPGWNEIDAVQLVGTES